MAGEQNPLLIPGVQPSRKLSCPKCKHGGYDCRLVQGVAHFVCDKCRHQWQGGLPQVAMHPSDPRPPEGQPPPVRFVTPLGLAPDGSSLPPIELDRPVDTTQYFRQGALVEDDNDV